MRFVVRAGLRELERHYRIARMNLLLLVITFVAGIFCISTILYQFRYYQGIHCLADGDGVFVLTEGLTGTNGVENLSNSEDLEEILPGTEVTVFYDTAVKCSLEGYGQDYYESIVYDDDCLAAFTPELEEGKWLSDIAPEDGLQAVVSSSRMNIHVGDSLKIIRDGKAAGDIHVIGVLKDGESAIGRANHFDAIYGFSYRNMYAEYDSSMDRPVIFLSGSNLEDVQTRAGETWIGTELCGGIFVRYSQGASEEQMAEYRNYLTGHIMSGGDKCVEFSQIEEDGKEYLADVLGQQLPIWICAFAVTAVSMICIELTSVKASLRDYAIYSLCGCSGKQIRKIPMVEMLILNGAACVVSILVTALCRWAGLVNREIIRFRIPVVAYCLFLVILMTLAASWYPARLWKKQSVKETLNMVEGGDAL